MLSQPLFLLVKAKLFALFRSSETCPLNRLGNEHSMFRGAESVQTTGNR
ncbi:hypothetical protein KOR42_19470 [Thalassoglobus neptunius]|uniref:Uncharacterized protein n=1 Tax=Thalassoglobus neptunius TaxID=1938619 RepID=A0A5C5X8T9_9PLAN|nr:hypothetical protein KOR42_19470 [Thalassoglobus neptunius]